MRLAPLSALVFGLFIPAQFAAAYELGTHGALSWQAYQRSMLNSDPSRLKDFGIDTTSSSPFGGIYYDVTGLQARERSENRFERLVITRDLASLGATPLSIPGWLMRGAIREDDLGFVLGVPQGKDPHDDPYGPFWRVMNHFYDPVRDIPLTLTAPQAFLFQTVTGESSAFHSAPAWGIGTTNANAFTQSNTLEANRRNHFAVFDAREAMYRALTGQDSAGNPLQPAPGGTLTQPADIRNAYWATTFRALGDILHLNQDMAQPQHTRNDPHSGVPGFGRESAFELYTEARATGAKNFKIDGTTVTPSPLNYGGYAVPTFAKYSDFWSTRQGLSGKGLADYSNQGFFSFGTNLGSNVYASPSNNPGSYVKESAAGLLPAQPAETINFLRGDVPDRLNPGPANIRATTESVFDLFLASPTYSLNRFNYDDMAGQLIPRAVAYSTGLINYFFRGKIDYVPDPGIPGNFLLKNLGPEDINGRFALYYDAQDGSRKPVLDRNNGLPVVWQTSTPLAAGTGQLSVTPNFTPPADAQSANTYMLVFNGDMGEEKQDIANGVVGAVATKLVELSTGILVQYPSDDPTNTAKFALLDFQGHTLQTWTYALDPSINEHVALTAVAGDKIALVQNLNGGSPDNGIIIVDRDFKFVKSATFGQLNVSADSPVFDDIGNANFCLIDADSVPPSFNVPKRFDTTLNFLNSYPQFDDANFFGTRNQAGPFSRAGRFVIEADTAGIIQIADLTTGATRAFDVGFPFDQALGGGGPTSGTSNTTQLIFGRGGPGGVTPSLYVFGYDGNLIRTITIGPASTTGSNVGLLVATDTELFGWATIDEKLSAFHVDLVTFAVTDVTANVTIPISSGGDSPRDNGWGMFLRNKSF